MACLCVYEWARVGVLCVIVYVMKFDVYVVSVCL